MENEAIREVAQEAIKRKTGARALRAILENIMLQVMYDVPSNDDVKKVVVPAGVISEQKEPLILTEADLKKAG